MTSREDSEAPRPSPQLLCWFCGAPFTSRHVTRDGILRSRTKAEGGPYHLYPCPECSQENACEKTPRGRWFVSPNCRITILDYVVSQFLDAESPGAKTLLAAIAWLRDNEERRRYFFEVDGDRRYRQTSWLRRLLAGTRTEPQRIGSEGWKREGARAEEARRAREEARPGEGRRQEGAVPPIGATRAPHQVLGVRVGADAAEIREAFRKLALHYHPDKVLHLGVDVERAAHRKFLELKEAYESLLEAERRRRR